MFSYQYKPNQATILSSERIDQEADIYVTAVGHSVLPNGYRFEAKRNLYVLHFVLSGKGKVMGQEIAAPIGFLFTPNTLQRYTVSEDPGDPLWEQYWVMFNGQNVVDSLSAARFRDTAGIFDIPYRDQLPQIFRILFSPEKYSEHDDHFLLLSLLYNLFSAHMFYQEQGHASFRGLNHYVREAIQYIKSHYQCKISGNDIAESVHISEKYLYKLFMKDFQVSPVKYLNQYRIQCAKDLLVTENTPIGEISQNVGFSEPEYFCHVFQKYSSGLCPSEYRRQNQCL